MKYLIKMKDGTQYEDEQPRGFIEQMGRWMSDDEPICHESADGRFLIRCSEIASVEKVDSQEDAA